MNKTSRPFAAVFYGFLMQFKEAAFSMKNRIKKYLPLLLPQALLCGITLLCGGLIGIITAIFGRVLLEIGTFRTDHLPYLLPFLPLAGVAMVWCYQKYGNGAEKGMGLIFDAANETEKKIPLRLLPMIMLSTWATHLFGGSAGREGVAVQIGATVSHAVGRQIPYLQRVPHFLQILTISGMAAGFSGLFHTPFAAVAFALEVLAVGRLYYNAFLPTVLSAISSYLVSCRMGLETFTVPVSTPEMSPLSPGFLCMGVAFGILGGLFALLLRILKKKLADWMPNPLWRVGICGAIVAILLFLVREGRYTGLGTNLIQAALHDQPIFYTDFALKLLFTVVTLSIGYQGGEVTPLFAMGAALGAVLAPFFGMPVILGAALGYAAVFGSASNTLLAPILIGGEVFGFENLPYFGIVCALAWLCNGSRSIYGKQATKFS